MKIIEKLKQNKGITLTALIITIIILLILSLIVLVSMRYNNMIKYTDDARTRYIKGDIKDRINLAIFDVQLDKKNIGKEITLKILHDELPDKDKRIRFENYEDGAEILNGIYKYENNKDYEFQLDKNGHIIGDIIISDTFDINVSDITTNSVKIEGIIPKFKRIKDYTYVVEKEQDSSSKMIKEHINEKSTIVYGLTQKTEYKVYMIAYSFDGSCLKSKVKTITTEEMPDKNLITGAIKFSNTTWIYKRASVNISTNTKYNIQYQINNTTGNWINGTNASNMKHNDILYARLTDGTNYTNYTSMVIKDSIAPIVTLTKGTITTKSISVTASATDNAEMPTLIYYKFYLNGKLKQNNTSSSFMADDLISNTLYTIKVEVQDAAGNTGVASTTITTEKMPTQAEVKGKIYFSEPEWIRKYANVSISTTSRYHVQWQVNNTIESQWKDTYLVTSLKHNDIIYARLSDGKNYSAYTTYTVKDTIKPVVQLTLKTRTTNSITVTASATDNAEMPISPNYKFYSAGKLLQSGTNNTCTLNNLLAGTNYYIYATVDDAVGNTGTSSRDAEFKTEVMPYIKITFTNNPSGWTNKNVTVTAKAEKPGYTMQMYNPSTGRYENRNSITVEKNGQVKARLTDGKNYTTECQTNIRNIDKTPPSGSGTVSYKAYSVSPGGTITACFDTLPIDSDSGFDHLDYTFSGAATGSGKIYKTRVYFSTRIKSTYKKGSCPTVYLKFTAYDKAGNKKDFSKSQTFIIK